MTQQQQTKDNSGTLFKNDRREKDTQPHAKGKALIGGRWYWMSAWTREPREGGDRYQSLAFTEMSDEQADKYGGHQAAPQANARAPSHRGPMDERAARGEGGAASMRPPKGPPVEAPFGTEQVFDEDSIPFRAEPNPLRGGV